ncbi:50S ribosomal protein L22 [Syntrophobacter fumaroxidans]|uniref:Large ribosomal subunit protein uL22 n=1 Tax=Syntrophobacter fumaroxidans (strain DSM 10017 / MPOB) TaxID=335543 RepID=RL22_SYNFM|nr:50S ribosomal protein L22 [Syntrophobacter fumaroxidans]A0LIJ5.1 RecName: Full=Large ribosomal subunit protein uL22; AltName: Full=50S ribosomal protein L22 [Syntrophobacter fumaroxidans MPOB]ABK17247.1 LSU ribosomal protein L22P [Syntrophobacter fumaroxidans MPOB]HOI93611.1 50S ribosomal protein L22 [Syntrophobacter fumaroxidans]
MEVRAVSKFLRVSPHKARLVADLVRGKKVSDALTILKFTPKKSGRFINKTLRSAVANAENTKSMDVETLFVKSIFVDKGPQLKRWRPRAMGRATKILKGSSHITIILAEK